MDEMQKLTAVNILLCAVEGKYQKPSKKWKSALELSEGLNLSTRVLLGRKRFLEEFTRVSQELATADCEPYDGVHPFSYLVSCFALFQYLTADFQKCLQVCKRGGTKRHC